MENHLLHSLVLIGLLGMGAQWVASLIRMPAIVALSVAGIVAGPVFGWLNPSEQFGEMLTVFVRLGVAVILFEGGISLRLHELREAASGVRRLTTIGVVASWLTVTLCGFYIGGLSLPVALVLGAILVVTGPTVIIPLLRQARLKRRPASLLKWEGIVNDPVGALLAVMVFQYFSYQAQAQDESAVLLNLMLAVGGAAAIGGIAGWVTGSVFRRGHVAEYLKAPLLIVIVLAVYALGDMLEEEAGLLAVTVMGVVVGNMRLPSIDELRRFKESITVLLVSGVFILLTADLDPALLHEMNWRVVALVAAVLFVARPVAILLSTVGADMSWQERVLLGWIAPRGVVAAAVAGIFAHDFLELGYQDAELLVPIVFSVVLSTVVLHGFSIGPLARYLGLAAEKRNGVLIAGASPWSTELGKALTAAKVPVLVVDGSWHRLRSARQAGLPFHYGEILSEWGEEALELNDIEAVLATSNNDALNAMICTRFAGEMGRNRVFQLPTGEQDRDDPKVFARQFRGIRVFDRAADFDELLRRHYRNWAIQRTRLTETYDFGRFKEDLPPGSIILLAVSRSGQVKFHIPDRSFAPEPGDTVLSYRPPDNSAALRRRSSDPERLPDAPANADAGVEKDSTGTDPTGNTG